MSVRDVFSQLERERVLVCGDDELGWPSRLTRSSEIRGNDAASPRVEVLQRFVEPGKRERGRRSEPEKARYQSGPDLLTAAQLAPRKLAIAGDSYGRSVRPELKAVLFE